ncbi:hypothetical protein PIB30_048480 [Stylosanthes scabra]|uniref:Uncharacterized protein n=1 Tax=Stylosanthes scabra TaxID=79078 RepID=A0ABU6QIL1_9FABA|nr:hypothetical protein [Stylosanthes scabra]
MLTVEEQRTWMAVVPIVCFMYVRMHHVDRVKRQLAGEQQVPKDPVNLDGLLAVSVRGEDQHWPTRHQQWRHAEFGFFPQLMRLMILVWMLFSIMFQPLFLSLGTDGEPQRPIEAIDSEEEAEYDRQEDVAGTSEHGGDAVTQGTHDAGGGPVADRYQRARAAAAATEHLAPVRPPPPSTSDDMSWIPPITPPSPGRGGVVH